MSRGNTEPMTEPTTHDAVVAYLNAHFRPDVAAELLTAAQPLMAIAWDEGWDTFARFDSRPGERYPANPYRSAQ